MGVAVCRVGELGEGGDESPGEVLSPRLTISLAADILSIINNTTNFQIQNNVGLGRQKTPNATISSINCSNDVRTIAMLATIFDCRGIGETTMIFSDARRNRYKSGHNDDQGVEETIWLLSGSLDNR